MNMKTLNEKIKTIDENIEEIRSYVNSRPPESCEEIIIIRKKFDFLISEQGYLTLVSETRKDSEEVNSYFGEQK